MSVNLYERNGVYYARIQTGGRDLRRSLQTRDEREAKRRLKKVLAESSPYHGSVRVSFYDAGAAWADAVRDSRKPKTWKRYALSMTILERTFAGRYIDQIDKGAIQDFIAARKAQGVSIATIRRDLTALSGMLEHAVDNEQLGANPVRTIPKRTMRYKPPVFVRPPDAAIEALLNELHGNLAAYGRFVLATGMRRDEALYLTRDQVDVRRKSARLDDTKNSKVRTVTLTDEAVEIVKRQVVDIRSPASVFVSRNGTPYQRATEMFREANLRLEVKAQKKAQPKPPRVMIHDLRHMYAIRYLENGGNLYVLKEQLGHGGIRQTEWYLSYLTPEAAAVAKFGAGTNTGTSA